MKQERLQQIFDETDAKWQGDNAWKGLQILSKYSDSLIEGAGHDIIYSVDVDKIVDKITEEDAISLRKLNWMIDEDNECFACFV